MAETTTSRHLYPERPLPGDQESQEREAVVDELLELIERAEPKHKLTVIGLYGERGSGKTSVLYRLLERAKAIPGLVRPRAPEDGNATPSAEELIFDPGLARDKEELPFDLITFLRRFGAEDASILDKAEVAQAQMDDPKRYLDLAKDLAPSASRLPEELAKRRVELSKADKTLHKELSEWGRRVTRGEGRRLLLLLDDVDLRPDLAYPLLDWVTRYLRDVPCVAVLCADEPTLVRAIEQALEDRDSPRGLGRLLLAKLVPLAAYVTPWRAEEAARLLLEGQHGVSPTITDLRPNPIYDIMAGLINNQVAVPLEPGLPPASEFDTNAATRSWGWLIGQLAPRNPRQLKRLHNRVVMEIDPKPNEGHERTVLLKWSRLLWNITPGERGLIFTFIFMVEMSHPEVGLWRRVLAVDETLLRDLRSIYGIGWWTLDDSDLATSSDDGVWIPGRLLAVFVDVDTKGAWSPSAQLRAANRLMVLCHVVSAVLFRQVQARRALAISLDADAAALVEVHLPGRQVDALNLSDGQYVRPPVSQMFARLERQRPRLHELAIALRDSGAQQPGAEVVAKAPASVLCWLGWNLRFTHLSGIYNDNSGRLTLFPLPSPRLEAREGRYGVGLFTPRDLLISPPASPESTSPPDDQCVLVIDMLRRVSEADITERFDVVLRPMRARLLQMKDLGRVLEPNDYNTVLQDLLDHINHMRKVEGVRVFHLAMVAQDVVAFGLGRQLHSQGVFHLYEWERATQRYVRMGTFPDDELPSETVDASAAAQDEPTVVRRGES
ncbi:hypothetical protein L6R49_24015 [Myxococcota bacterium]|nr:hypothetical protein [Myxococcota bacterium]